MLWRRRLPGAPAAAGVIGRGEEDIFFCRQKATVFRVELARTATGRGEKKDSFTAGRKQRLELRAAPRTNFQSFLGWN